MAKKVQHFGQFDVSTGRLQAGSFEAALNVLRARRVPVVLTIEEFRGSRSNQANRYYWGVVVELIHNAMNEGGMEISREATHDLLKFRFLKEDRPIGDGEFIAIVKGTSELNRKEFAEYLEHCKRFAAEYLNTVIPEPGEQMDMELAA